MSMADTLSRPTLVLEPNTLPPRDPDGYLLHPALRALNPDVSLEAQLRGHGYDVVQVAMQADPQDRYAAQNSEDCSWWEPEAPAGDHWFLVLITQTDDHGPVAVYVRPYSATPCPPNVTWGVFNDHEDYPDAVIARAFHGDHLTDLVICGATVEEVIAQLPADVTIQECMPHDRAGFVCTAISERTADQSVRG